MKRFVRGGLFVWAVLLGVTCALPGTAVAVTTGIEVTVVHGAVPVGGAKLFAFEAKSFEAEVAKATTNGSGVATLPTGEGEFKVSVAPPGGSGFFAQWYDNKETQVLANVVTVAPGNLVPITASVQPELEISGTLLDAETKAPLGPSAGGSVEVRENNVRLLGVGSTAENGSFKVGGLHPGSYIVRPNATGYPGTWYQLKYSEAAAERVAAGTTGLTVLDRATGTITGRVTNAGTGELVEKITVVARDAGSGEALATATTTVSGFYELIVPGGVPVHLEFQGGVLFATQFYNGKGTLACADAVTVAEHKKLESINAAMTPMGSTLGGCSSPGGGGGNGGSGGGGGGGGGGGSTIVPLATVSKVALAAGNVVKVLSGKAAVSVGCAGGSPCAVKLALTSSKLGKAARAARAKPVLVAGASATIPAGTTRRVTLKLTRAGLRLLAAHHGRIKARLAVTGTAGTTPLGATGTVTLVLAHHR